MKNVAYFVNVISGMDKGKKYLLLSNTARSRTTALLELKQGKIIDVIPCIHGIIKNVIKALSKPDNKIDASELTDSYYFDKDRFNVNLFLREYEQIKF